MTQSLLPLVHVGLAKTASTFLQQAVFPKLDTVQYLGKNTPDEALRQAGMMVVRATSLNYKPEKVAAAFQPHLDMAADRNRRPLYSEEDLSVFKFMDPRTSAGRLSKLFGPYDVVLVGRDPFSWVQSQYQFRLSTYHPLTLWGINHWFRHHQKVVGVGSDITEVHFTGVMDMYREACGGTVHFLPYELLSRDKRNFSGRLAGIVGVETETLLPLIDAPQERRSYKGRITATESRFIQEARYILQRDSRGLLQALESYFDLDGARPDPAAMAQLRILAEAEQSDFSAWVEPLQKLRRSLVPAFEKASQPADETLVSEYVEFLDAVGARQRQRLRKSFGIDLDALGIAYHGDL